MYITKTANVSISGITEVSEIAQMASLCLRSVVKMAENKMPQVAALFGKKLGRVFKVRYAGMTASANFSSQGLCVEYKPWGHGAKVLSLLLAGKAEIVEDEK
jgi:hypothetical protein